MNSKIESFNALDGLSFQLEDHKPRIDKEKKEIEYFVSCMVNYLSKARLQSIKEILQAKEIKTYFEDSDIENSYAGVPYIGLIFDNKISMEVIA